MRLAKLLGIALLSTVLLWAPFVLRWPSFWGIDLPRNGMLVVKANYDGPLYIVVAKTFYNFSNGNKFEFPLSNQYYSAHFPLYPSLIRLMSWLRYDNSMIIVTLLGSVLATAVVYFMGRERLGDEKSFWITVVFLFFPARYFVLRSVGSPEPWFMAFILASVWSFTKKRYWLAGIFGALATITKSPGILLFVSYATYLFTNWRKVGHYSKVLPLLLIPLALLSVFLLYGANYHDFWAYFHSGDNIHLQSLPFRIFNSSQPWVGTHWLEDVIWIYLAGLLGLSTLIDQKRWEEAIFVGVYLGTIFFVSHRDIARYSLPIFPLILLSWGDIVSQKRYRWVWGVLILAIFVYSVNFMVGNTMPISNWGLLE